MATLCSSKESKTIKILPIEMIHEILSKLPIKSLCRFKSVSKSWHTLIKSPNFITTHLNNSLKFNTNRHILLVYSSLSFAELNPNSTHLNFSELNHPLEPTNQKCQYFNGNLPLLGFCNGILCISDLGKNDIVLYNPLIKTHRMIPQPLFCSSYPPISVVFGFGYDNITDDYKVLRAVCNLRDEHLEGQVYSFKGNSWKKVDDFGVYDVYQCHSGVLVNQNLHYLVRKDKFESEFSWIVSFDLHNETWGFVDSPKVKFESTYKLEKLDECLCFVSVSSCACKVECWIMREYGKKESWARLFCIREPKSSPLLFCIKPLAFSQDGGKVLIEEYYEDHDEYSFKLSWHDLKKKKSKNIKVWGASYDQTFESFVFVGSLVDLSEDQPHLGAIMPKID